MEFYRDVGSSTGRNSIPEELRSHAAWMGSRVRRLPNGKLDKPPYRVRAGKPVAKADYTDPRNHATFEEARAALVRGDVSVIGFVFSEADPYFVVDQDAVIHRETGEIDRTACEVIHALDTYTEISISGAGLHTIGKGTKPDGAGCVSNTLGHKIEVYDRARFVVITGDALHAHRAPLERQVELEELCRKVWPERSREDREQRRSALVDLADEELLERARRARTGAKFRTLFDKGETDGYPSQSEADYALANMLVFWTAGDRERMVRLFERAALYRGREKHRGYVQRTVDNASRTYVGDYYLPRDVRRARREEADPLAPFLDLLLDPTRWQGKRGASAYKAYAAVVIRAAEHGIVDDSGRLRIGCDVRTLAEIAGMRRETMGRSALPYLIQEMKLLRWLRGKGRHAGVLVLQTPPVLKRTNKISTHFSGAFQHAHENALETLRLLIRMRSGRAKRARFARLGMVAMFVAVALCSTPSRGYDLAELAERTGRRAPDLRRVLERLESAAIVQEPRPGYYQLTERFRAEWERELEQSGITYSEREQRRRHADDRAARDARLPPDKQPEPLRGREHVRRTVEKNREQAKPRAVAEERRRVAEMAAAFVADALADVIFVRWRDMQDRWRGSREALWAAVRAGPYVIRREPGDLGLCVYHSDGRDEDAYDRMVRERSRRLEEGDA